MCGSPKQVKFKKTSDRHVMLWAGLAPDIIAYFLGGRLGAEQEKLLSSRAGIFVEIFWKSPLLELFFFFFFLLSLEKDFYSFFCFFMAELFCRHGVGWVGFN